MRDYGYETYRPDGSTIMDGTSKAGVFLGVLSIPASSMSGSQSYPASSAGNLYCLNVDSGAHDFTVDVDPSGHDRVNWTRRSANAASTRLFVFSRLVVSPSDYGVLVVDNAGKTLLDLNYPVPQYAGTVQPAAAAQSSYLCAAGNLGNTHLAPAANLRPGTNRVVLMALPDSGTADIWYACDSLIGADNTSGFSLAVNVFAPSGVAYRVPSLHIYSLDGPVASSSGYGMQLLTTAQALVYDSSAENVSVRDSVIVNYPSPPTTVTYTLDLPANAGVLIPYFYRADRSTSGTDKYVSVVKRVGNQLTFKTMYLTHTPPDPVILESYQLGASSNSYCVAVDLSHLGGTSVAGVPNGVVQSVPVINTQPASQSVLSGAAVTFSIAASGNPSPTHQWRRGGVNIAGATSSSYGITAATGDNGAVFSCVVSNTFNGSTNNVVSNDATLSVAAGVAPTITSNPSSQSIVEGQTASFVASASGTAPFSYAWYKSGSGTVRSTSQTYAFAVAAGDAGDYSCVISNSYGSAASAIATLTVTPVLVGVSLTSQPQNTTVIVGQSASFSCSASGSATINYTWHRADGTYMYTGSTLTIASTTAADAGGYYCVVSNSVNSVQSNTATLTVNNPPGVPTITTQPVDVTSGSAQPVTFSCAATSTGGALVYTWYLYGVTAPVGTGASLTVTASTDTAGNYRCRVSNDVGYTDSNYAGLAIRDTAPAISVQPTSVTTPQGTAVTLTCTASPVSRYEWRNTASGGILGTGPTFSPPVGTVGSISYSCIAVNYTANTVSSSATVTVSGPPGNTFPSYITISGSVYALNEACQFTINTNGTVTGTDSNGTAGVAGWANPTGDASLYEVMAVPNTSFVAAGASAALSTWINVGSHPTWALQPPTKVGLTRGGNLAFTVRLISTGATVTSGSVSFANEMA